MWPYKIAAVATAIVNTAQGVTAELKKGIAGIPTAVVIAAAGLAEIQAIKATSFGGGGAAPTFAASPATGLPVGGLADQPGVAAPVSPGPRVRADITIVGTSFNRDTVLELIDEINDLIGDGVELAPR